MSEWPPTEGEPPPARESEPSEPTAPIEPTAPDEPSSAVVPRGPIVVERIGSDAGPPPLIQDADEAFWRATVRWGTIALLSLFLISVLLAWSTIQVTGEGPASRILKRALVPLTELDNLLDSEYENLIAQAQQGDVTAIVVPHYPLLIQIPSRELAELSSSELRQHILAESAAMLYRDGISAFSTGEASGRNDSVFSPRGALRLTLGQLTESSHQLAQIAGGFLAFVALLLLLLVVMLSRGFGRIQNVGLALTIGAIPMALAVVAVRFSLRTMADGADDPFNAEYLRIGADVAWIPIRNFVIFAILGMLILALGIILGLWQQRWTEPGRWARGRQERLR